MIRVAIMIGTRPEAIKLMPLFLELRKSEKFLPHVIFTGQHRDMVDEILGLFKVSSSFSLNTMVTGQSLEMLTSNLFREIGQMLAENKMEAVIVQGDTTSAFVGSMVGFYQKLSVIHVEAGLRTNDKMSPFPEEINRQLIGKLADFHFAPTSIALNNLKLENAKNRFLVGNTGIDSLEFMKDHFYESREVYKNYFDCLDFEAEIVLITAHRRENHGEGISSICDAVDRLAGSYPEIQFVFPVHPNPSVKQIVEMQLSDISNIFLTTPLSYDKLLFLINESKLILTDSGGIQEEAPSFNTPLLVLRETTERPEGIESGCAVLVGTNVQSITETFDKMYKDESLAERMKRSENPYGDGQSSTRIVKILEEHL